MCRHKDDWDNTVISEYTGEGVRQPCRMVRRDNIKYIYTHGFQSLLYDWDPDLTYAKCIQSQKERMFIQNRTNGEPSSAFQFAYDDEKRFIRNSSAVDTKAKARYPFITPTPFEK